MQFNEQFLDTVDLRGLYPDLYGNPVHVHCHINPAHHDTGKPNLAVNPNYVFCFRCRTHMGALQYLVLCSQQDPAKFGCTFRTTAEARDWAEAHLCAEVPLSVTMHDLAPLDTRQIAINRASLERQPERALYLETRYGLTARTQEMCQLGHTGVAFAIPVYDEQGEAVNIRFRIDPQRMPQAAVRYWSLAGRGQPRLYVPPPLRTGWKDAVPPSFAAIQQRTGLDWVLCEGEFDAMLLWQLKCLGVTATDGASALAGKHADLLDAFAGCRVAVAYDQDEAGQEYGPQVVQLLRERGATAYLVEWDGRRGKDFTDLARNGHADSIPTILRSCSRLHQQAGAFAA